MCDYSGKLVAWLDQELSRDEAASVEEHVRACSECRGQVESYEQVSGAFAAYCDFAERSCRAGAQHAAPLHGQRRRPLWVPVGAGAVGVLVAAACLLVVFDRRHVEQPFVGPPVAGILSANTPETPVATTAAGGRAKARPYVEELAKRKAHRRHVAAPAKSESVNWVPAEPAIQIAFPAEAMFPPGAVPAGVNFVADVSLAADGSAQRMLVRPRLIEYERRTTQP